MQQFLIGFGARKISLKVQVVIMPGVSRRPTFISRGSALVKGKRFNKDPGLQQQLGILESSLAKSHEEKQVLLTELEGLKEQLLAVKTKQQNKENATWPIHSSNEAPCGIDFDQNLNHVAEYSEIGSKSDVEKVTDSLNSKLIVLQPKWNDDENLKKQLDCDLEETTAELSDTTFEKPLHPNLESTENGQSSVIKKLRIEMAEIAEEAKSMHTQLEDYREQLGTCKNKLFQMNEEKAFLKEAEVSLLSQIDKVKKKESTLIGQMRDLQQKHDEVQMSFAAQTKELQQKTDKIKELEAVKCDTLQQLECEQLDHRLLQARYAALQMERDNHLQQLRLTLEEGAKEKKELQEKFDKEMELLRNCDTQRDHQLMDDYEWKLREIERDYKLKMDGERKKHQEATEKLKKTLENEFERQQAQATRTLEVLKVQVEDLQSEKEKRSHLADVELNQLRGVTEELQKGIKAATAQADEKRVAERCLQEDLRKSEEKLQKTKLEVSKLQSEICDLKEQHVQRLRSVRDVNKRQLEESKGDIESRWKNHYRDECSKLQTVLEKEYENEKQFALEALQTKKNTEMIMLQTEHEQREAELALELHSLQQRNNELTLQLNKAKEAKLESDKCVSDLENQIKEVQASWEKEVNKLGKTAEKMSEERQEQENIAMIQLREELELQKSFQQETTVLMAEQMKDHRELQQAMENQRLEYECERQKAVEEVINDHKHDLQVLRQEFDKALTVIKQKDKYIKDLEVEFQYRERQAQDLQMASDSLQKRLKQMSLQLQHQGNSSDPLNQDAQNSRFSDAQVGCSGITPSCLKGSTDGRPARNRNKKKNRCSASESGSVGDISGEDQEKRACPGKAPSSDTIVPPIRKKRGCCCSSARSKTSIKV